MQIGQIGEYVGVGPASSDDRSLLAVGDMGQSTLSDAGLQFLHCRLMWSDSTSR